MDIVFSVRVDNKKVDMTLEQILQLTPQYALCGYVTVYEHGVKFINLQFQCVSFFKENGEHTEESLDLDTFTGYEEIHEKLGEKVAHFYCKK